MKRVISILQAFFIFGILNCYASQSKLNSAIQLSVESLQATNGSSTRVISCELNQRLSDIQVIYMSLQTSESCDDLDSSTLLAHVDLWKSQPVLETAAHFVKVYGKIDLDNDANTHLTVPQTGVDDQGHQACAYRCVVQGVDIRGQAITATQCEDPEDLIETIIDECENTSRQLDFVFWQLQSHIKNEDLHCSKDDINSISESVDMFNITLAQQAQGVNDKFDSLHKSFEDQRMHNVLQQNDNKENIEIVRKKIEELNVTNKVENLDDKIGAINTTVHGHEDKIGAIDTAIQGLENKVGTVDTAMHIYEDKIGAINTTVQEHEDRMGAIDTTVQGHEDKIGAIDTTVQGHEDKIGAIDTTVQGHEDKIGAINTTVQEHEDKMGAIDTTVQGHEDKIGAIDTTVQGHEDKIGAIDTTVQGHEDKMGAIDTTVQGLENKVGTVDKKILGLENKLGTVDNRILGLENKVGTVDNKILGLENNIGELKTAIQLLDSTIKGYGTQIQSMSSTIDKLKIITRFDSINWH